MSVIVANSISGGSGGSGSSTLLYRENAVSPTIPQALGNNSIAFGSGAVARLDNSIVQAGGYFLTAGDAQVGRHILRVETIDAAETELLMNGATRLVLPDNSTWTFTATITGHRTDATDGHAGFVIRGVIYRVAGVSSVLLQGSPVKETISRSNWGWNVNAYADATNGSLKITASGQAGKIIRWVALVETVEVTS